MTQTLSLTYTMRVSPTCRIPVQRRNFGYRHHSRNHKPRALRGFSLLQHPHKMINHRAKFVQGLGRHVQRARIEMFCGGPTSKAWYFRVIEKTIVQFCVAIRQVPTRTARVSSRTITDGSQERAGRENASRNSIRDACKDGPSNDTR